MSWFESRREAQAKGEEESRNPDEGLGGVHQAISLKLSAAKIEKPKLAENERKEANREANKEGLKVDRGSITPSPAGSRFASNCGYITRIAKAPG